MSLTETEISHIESALAAFEPDATDIEITTNDLLRALRRYQQMLRAQDPDRGSRQLAELERVNPVAYEKVLATVPVQSREAVRGYVAANKGQPLPPVKQVQSVSAVIGKSGAPVKVL